jgi:oligoribonuclease NrnB/cAMP/cGMP phosphodiesterase (DHH superfamily)
MSEVQSFFEQYGPKIGNTSARKVLERHCAISNNNELLKSYSNYKNWCRSSPVSYGNFLWNHNKWSAKLCGQLKNLFRDAFDENLDSLLVFDESDYNYLLNLFSKCSVNFLTGCWSHDEALYDEVSLYLGREGKKDFFLPFGLSEEIFFDSSESVQLVRHHPKNCRIHYQNARCCCRPSHLSFSSQDRIQMDTHYIELLQKSKAYKLQLENFVLNINSIFDELTEISEICFNGDDFVETEQMQIGSDDE